MKLIYIAFILLIIFTGKNAKAYTFNRDSLERVLKNTNVPDSSRVLSALHLMYHCKSEDAKKVHEYYILSMKIAKGNNKFMGEVCAQYSFYITDKLKDYSNGLKFLKRSTDYFQKVKSYTNLRNNYHTLARVIFERLGMVDETIDAFKQSIKYAKLENTNHEGYIYYELGWFETFTGYPDSAFVHLQKSYKLNDKRNFGQTVELLIWMGNTFNARKQFRKALHYQQKAMHIADSLHEDGLIAECSRYEAQTYRELGILDSSVLLMKRAVELYITRRDFRTYYAGSMLINWLSFDKRHTEAKKYIDLLDDGKIYDYTKEDEMHSFYLLSKYLYCYEDKDYKQAVAYLKKYVDLQDSINARLRRYDLGEQNLKMKFLEQQEVLELKQQKKDLQAKAELQSQKTFAYVLTVIIAFVVVLLVLSIRNMRQKKAAFEEISIQKREVERQKALVDTKNKEVTDSIHYAHRIQSALMAHQDHLNEFVPNNFIYFKPKDIVSGDFYWTTKRIVEDENGKEKSLFYFAVCDSTGHGVPGAFMSLLNIGFLSEAISEKNILEPHDVFTYVRSRLISTISQEEQKDGFDGVLICFDKEKMKIKYAAANNAIIHCTNSVCSKLDRDHVPVGQAPYLRYFNLRSFTVKPGDTIYLQTDGYADQFGGDKRKRFISANLQKLLQSNIELSMNEQLAVLDKTFIDWKGNYDQIDDVCVIGIKF